MKIFVLFSLLLSTSAFASSTAYLLVRQQGQSVDLGASDKTLLAQALRSATQNAVDECVEDYQGTPSNTVCITDRESGPILRSRKGAGVRKAKVWIRMYCRASKASISNWDSFWYERDGTNFTNCLERVPVNQILQ